MSRIAEVPLHFPRSRGARGEILYRELPMGARYYLRPPPIGACKCFTLLSTNGQILTT